MADIYNARFLERDIAHLKGVRSEVKVARDVVYGRARGLFAPHNKPGGARITRSSGGLDYFVNLDDGDESPAAAAIEFGWTTKSGKPVDGLHVLGRAAR